jgi:hypothetical protein
VGTLRTRLQRILGKPAPGCRIAAADTWPIQSSSSPAASDSLACSIKWSASFGANEVLDVTAKAGEIEFQSAVGAFGGPRRVGTTREDSAAKQTLFLPPRDRRSFIPTDEILR